jgi:hypothetical protein
VIIGICIVLGLIDSMLAGAGQVAAGSRGAAQTLASAGSGDEMRSGRFRPLHLAMSRYLSDPFSKKAI